MIQKKKGYNFEKDGKNYNFAIVGLTNGIDVSFYMPKIVGKIS